MDRIVDNALDGDNVEGKELFAELRQKRASGQYKQVYYFEPQITRRTASPFPTPNNQPLYLSCGDLIEDRGDDGAKSGWRYEPHLTPLPEEVISRIKASFKQPKRQLRQDKTTSRYPTLDAITRLFNYLYSGRKTSSRRASQKLLVQMGFVGRSSKRTQIFRLLEQDRLLYKGGYLSKTQSRLWTLDKTVIEAMWRERAGQHDVAS